MSRSRPYAKRQKPSGPTVAAPPRPRAMDAVSPVPLDALRPAASPQPANAASQLSADRKMDSRAPDPSHTAPLWSLLIPIVIAFAGTAWAIYQGARVDAVSEQLNSMQYEPIVRVVGPAGLDSIDMQFPTLVEAARLPASYASRSKTR